MSPAPANMEKASSRSATNSIVETTCNHKGCAGSFTGIYSSQVFLCGQGGPSGAAQPRQVVINTSATPVKAAALASEQLLRENGGAKEDVYPHSFVCPGSAHTKLLIKHSSSEPRCRCVWFPGLSSLVEGPSPGAAVSGPG